MSTRQAALTGPQKAAVLLVTLGHERSAMLLNGLRDWEVEQVMREVARLEDIPADTVERVVLEAADATAMRAGAARGGLEFAEQVLRQSIGPERAAELMRRLNDTALGSPFQFLSGAEPRQILSLLVGEHPQTIAFVLAHLPAAQAAAVLAGLPAAEQSDVAHRIATMNRTAPDAVTRVTEVLQRRASALVGETQTSVVGGLQPLVDIINRSDRGTEKMILEGFEQRDPELAEQLRAQMFVFEDITTLDDRAVQLVLRQIDTGQLAIALKGVRADVQDKVLKNVSERAAKNLRDEMEVMGRVRLQAVEEAQAAVVAAIRMLEQEGQLTLTRGGDDEFVA